MHNGFLAKGIYEYVYTTHEYHLNQGTKTIKIQEGYLINGYVNGNIGYIYFYLIRGVFMMSCQLCLFISIYGQFFACVVILGMYQSLFKLLFR